MAIQYKTPQPPDSDAPWAVAMEIRRLTKAVAKLGDAVTLLSGTQQGTCEDFATDARRTLAAALNYDDALEPAPINPETWARISRLRLAIGEALYQIDKATGGRDEDPTP